jgi:hypothetical protein
MDRPDIVVVSDVLYAPESAAPLVATLRQLFGRPTTTAKSAARSVGGRPAPAVCYLAW